MADQSNLQHIGGCNGVGCWRDEAGTEYHRGNYYGIYVVVDNSLPSYISAMARIMRNTNTQEMPAEPLTTEEAANHPQQVGKYRRIIILDEEETA